MRQISWLLLFLAAINFAQALVIINFSSYGSALAGYVLLPVWVPTLMLLVAAITAMVSITTVETYDVVRKAPPKRRRR